MAEYAGLEIRIGGNTTKLTNALKASTKSAAELQSRIRQVTKAMQFDPTNLGNVATRIKITGDRMQSLQSKAQITRAAMDQLGESFTHLMNADGTAKTVRQVASEVANASLAAKQADERFNRLVGSLAEVYKAWNSLSRSKGSDFLVDQLGLSQADADRLMKDTTSLREFASELRIIQAERANPLYSGTGGFISDAEIERARQFKELNFHDMFKRGLSLDDVIAEAQKLGVVLEDSAISNVRELQKAFKEAQEEKQTFDSALKFQQMGNDLQAVESEAEKMSQTMRSLDDGLTLVSRSPWFQGLEEDLRRVDGALDNVNDDLKSTREALNADPGNVQLAARYMEDLHQKAELSSERLEILKGQMSHLEMAGAGQAIAEHQDLAKWIEESAEAARTAQKAYSDQRATVANLRDQVASASQAIATLKGDETIAMYSDGVLAWKKQTELLAKAMEELSKAEGSVATEQGKLGEIQGNLDRAKKSVTEYENSLGELRDTYQRLREAYDGVYDSPTVDFDTKNSMYMRLQELEAEIKQVEASYGGAQQEVKEFGRELSKQQGQVSTAEDKLRQAREAVDDLQKAVAELEKTREVKLFQNPDEELERTEAELVDLKGKLSDAIAEEKRLASAYKAKETKNELAKTAHALQKTGQEANEAAADLERIRNELSTKGNGILNASTVKSIGMTLSATITPLLVGLGHSMVSASSDVDAAYRDMRKTVEGTEEQFESLKAAAIDFSRTHVTSADQILQIEAIGGELGVATESLQTFAEVISNLDVATNLDTEGAATALGHLANIMQLSEDDYVGFSDALVRLGNNGASTETEIANIAERIGSMASIVHMSAPDVLAWASSIASTGQNAEAAGTAISKTMSFFETAVSAAGGTIDTSFEAIGDAVQKGGSELVIFSNLMGQTSDEFVEAWASNPETAFEGVTESVEGAKKSLQGIADVAGMTANEFAHAWESDPTSVMKAFIEGLNEVEASSGSADAVLQNLGITSVRQKQAIEGLMQTIGGLDDNLEMSNDAWNGISDKWGQAGDAANEAAKKAEGFSGQIQILKNVWQIFLSELGEGAAPWVKTFTENITGLSSHFSSLSAETKKWIVAAGGIAAAAGPVLSFGATVATAKGDLVTWFKTTTSGLNLMKLAYKHGGIEMVKAMRETATTMDKVKLVGLELGSSLVTGLKAAIVVASILAIGTALKKLYDDYKAHEKATVGLSSALSGIGKAAKVAGDGIASSAGDFQKAMRESQNYEKRLASLTDTLEESNAQYGSYAGQMDYYASVIKELGGKSELTQTEMGKLSAALSAVNDACGTSYQLNEYGDIIDSSTGKVMANTDAILANIDARRNQALLDYYADDYAQAVEQWAAAQANLNKVQEEYNHLTSTEGKQEYLDFIREQAGLQGRFISDAEALEVYEQHVDNVRGALEGYEEEVRATETVMSDVEAQMDVARAKMDSATRATEEAAKAQEDFDKRVSKVTSDTTGNMSRLSAAVTEAGGGDAAFNSIAEGLNTIHVYANELDKVDMSALVAAFDGIDGSMADVIKTLEDAGVSTKTWHAAIDEVPGAAERMGSISSAAFAGMYEAAGQDLSATMELIAGLDAMEVEGKTFFIGDDGTIIDEQGRIYDLTKDIGAIPEEVITKLAGDDADLKQRLLDAHRGLDELDGRTATATVNINDYASARIDYLMQRLTELGNKRTNTVITVAEQATGGMNSRPVIPRNATGYIATGPTLTNQGWIGEDGIEAVANWATGGAVVPLTNKRYMLPIADAIASGMAARGAGGSNQTINITLAYDASADANDMVRDLARAVSRSKLARG